MRARSVGAVHNINALSLLGNQLQDESILPNDLERYFHNARRFLDNPAQFVHDLANEKNIKYRRHPLPVDWTPGKDYLQMQTALEGLKTLFDEYVEETKRDTEGMRAATASKHDAFTSRPRGKVLGRIDPDELKRRMGLSSHQTPPQR
jgi:hypothetical protein